MDIVHVRSHKKAWLPLLLVGDESEAMIDRYLDRGELFVLHDPDARGLCVVTRESEGVAEIRACLETHLSIMKRFNSMLAMAI